MLKKFVLMAVLVVSFVMVYRFESMSADEIQLQPQSTCVILLHGLGRTGDSMNKMAKSLSQAGYFVWNESYPSRDKPIDELAQAAIEPAVEFCQANKVKQINFVTHSLGGILVRYFLQEHEIKNLSRIVMLSPPNKGSEIADELKEYKIYQFVTGPAGQQLGTDENSVPNTLQPINGEIGVIIGNATSDPWFSWLIPGDDDGKVSVERARLDEMKDFLVVDAGHTYIMRKQAVIDQVKTFLSHGQFDHSDQKS